MDCQLTEHWKSCCCNCKHQKTIYKHPWNKGAGQGGIMDIMGYGCGVPEFENCDDGSRPVIFFDGKHGMCEMHMRRPELRNDVTPSPKT